MICECCQRKFAANPPPNAEWLFARLAAAVLLPLDEIERGSRAAWLMRRFHAVLFVMREQGLSYPKIGAATRRHHSTIISDVSRVRRRLQSGNYPEMAKLVAAARKAA
jgi:hypothetical protein